MDGRHTRVGFRVLSTTLSADEIARRAGLDAAPAATAPPLRPVGRETVWVVDSPLGPERPLEDRLAALLDVVEPYARRLHWLGEGCLMHVFVGRDAVTHPGECALLPPALLGRLARLPGEGVLVEVRETARLPEPAVV